MSNTINIQVPVGADPWVTQLVRNIEQAVQHALKVPTITTLTLQAATTNVLTTRQSMVNQAGVAGGTLLNAPSAGNPTKWVAVNDGGTARYLPLW